MTEVYLVREESVMTIISFPLTVLR